MRKSFAVLTGFMLLAAPLSAETIPVFNESVTVLNPAADNEVNFLFGGGILDQDPDLILNFGFIEFGNAFANQGNILPLTLSVTPGETDLAWVEAVLLAVDATGANFVSTTGLLGASDWGSFNVDLDFSSVEEYALSLTFSNSFFEDPSNPSEIRYSLFGAYAGPTVAPVPLPAGGWLLLAGLGGLMALKKRRKTA